MTLPNAFNVCRMPKRSKEAWPTGLSPFCYDMPLVFPYEMGGLDP